MSDDVVRMVRDLAARLREQEMQEHARSTVLFPLLGRLDVFEMAAVIEAMDLADEWSSPAPAG